MDLPGALRRRGQKDPGRGRHPQRRGMMLGDVIAEKSRRIVFAQQFEPALVEAIKAVIPALNMVENAEFNLAHGGPLAFQSMEFRLERRLESRPYKKAHDDPAQPR